MIDIEELKKLPTPIKVQLVDQLLESIEGEWDETNEDDEVEDDILEEVERRYHAVRSGEMQTIPWSEAKKILLNDIRSRRASND